MAENFSKSEIRRRLYDQVRCEAPALLLGSAAMLCSSLSNQALPRLLGRLLDQDSKGTAHVNSRYSLNYSLGLVVLGGGVASFLRTTVLRRVKDEMACRLRQDAFVSLMTDKDLEWFQACSFKGTSEDASIVADNDPIVESRPYGVSGATIETILTTDVDTMSNALTTSLANLLRSASAVIFGTYHMLSLNPSLFAASFTVVPAVGAAAMVLRKRSRRLAERERQLASERADFLQERIEHIHMVKLCHKEHEEIRQYAERNKAAYDVAKAVALQSGLFMGSVFVASSSALLLVIQLGAKAVAAGSMTHGQLTSFGTYSFLLGLGTSGLMSAAGEMARGMVAAQRYYQLIDTHMTANEKKESSKRPLQKEVSVTVSNVSTISLENVSLSYRSTGRQVLRGIFLELKQGQVVALVGENGSGKSSLVSVLAGLYKPSSGKVLVNGTTDLMTISKAAKKKLIQVIPQSTALFNISILENIRYSDPGATEEDVRKALHQANCDEFVNKLPGNIHFLVGMNGKKLSGGERQRLALARALLSDPAILVMDEPSSFLDATGEAAVNKALKSCQDPVQAGGKKRSILLVTHNPKSLLQADGIVVMKDGEIVEQGPLEKLIHQDSYLRHLMPSLFPNV